MTDDRSQTGAKDRSQVNSNEEYEIAHLAKKFKVKPEVVRLAEATVGKSRVKIEEYLKNSAPT